VAFASPVANYPSEIGSELAVPVHLQDGDEFKLSSPDLVSYGEKLFDAMWTIQDGGGRPMTKGTGAPLSDPTQPLFFSTEF